MIRISASVRLLAGAGLLMGGLAIVLFGSVMLYRGESVPPLFLLGGVLLAWIGGVITIGLAERYCRIQRESGSPTVDGDPG
jgi:hypothetical protein